MSKFASAINTSVTRNKETETWLGLGASVFLSFLVRRSPLAEIPNKVVTIFLRFFMAETGWWTLFVCSTRVHFNARRHQLRP